jgi:hypothetical protein
MAEGSRHLTGLVRKAYLLACACALGGFGCKKAPLVHPAEVRRVNADEIEIVPRPGAPPKCVAFSVSDQGVVRTLVMAEDIFSLDCPPGKPAALDGKPIYVPANEGKARIIVVFSDERLEAARIQNQVWDLRQKRDLGPRDIRVPEHAIADVIAVDGNAPAANR